MFNNGSGLSEDLIAVQEVVSSIILKCVYRMISNSLPLVRISKSGGYIG